MAQGQRLMQEASDIFLGWTHNQVIDLYILQLRDMKLLEAITILTTTAYGMTKAARRNGLARLNWVFTVEPGIPRIRPISA